MFTLLAHELKKLALPTLLFLLLELLIGLFLPRTGGENIAYSGYLVLAIHLLFLAVLGSLASGEERIRQTEVFMLSLPISRMRLLSTRIIAAFTPAVLSTILVLHFALQHLDAMALRVTSRWLHLPESQLVLFFCIISLLIYSLSLLLAQWLEQPITATLGAAILTTALIQGLVPFTRLIHAGWLLGFLSIPLLIASFRSFQRAALESPPRRVKSSLPTLLTGLFMIPPILLLIHHGLYSTASQFRVYHKTAQFDDQGNRHVALHATCLNESVSPLTPLETEGLPVQFTYQARNSRLLRYPELYAIEANHSPETGTRALITPHFNPFLIPNPQQWKLSISIPQGKTTTIYNSFPLAFNAGGSFSPRGRYFIQMIRNGDQSPGQNKGTRIQIYQSPDWKNIHTVQLPDWFYRCQWLDETAAEDDSILYLSVKSWGPRYKESIRQIWSLQPAAGTLTNVTPVLPDPLAIDEICHLRDSTLLLTLISPREADDDHRKSIHSLALYHLESGTLQIIPMEQFPEGIPEIRAPWWFYNWSPIFMTDTGKVRFLNQSENDSTDIMELDPITGSMEILLKGPRYQPSRYIIHTRDRSRCIYSNIRNGNTDQLLDINLAQATVTPVTPSGEMKWKIPRPAETLDLVDHILHFHDGDIIRQLDLNTGRLVRAIPLSEAEYWQP